MMRASSMYVLAILLALLAPTDGTAQETQVPLDRDGQIEEIDRSLARRLGLFVDEYPDLQTVRLYRVSGEEFVLEVSFRRDGRISRQRVAMTAAEVRQLRDRVSAALARNAPEVVLDQDGRFLLLTSTTALGLGYYGWAVPVILDIDDGRGILASYMLTAGASFVFPYLYTRERPVTYGMANAGWWGASRGIVHGVLLAFALDNDPSAAMATGFGLGASLVGGLAGYNWARSAELSAGDVHVIGNYGDFGFSWAGHVMTVIQPDAESLVYGSLVAGGIAGLAVGPSRARALPYTWGDAEIQRTAFYLGSANGAALWDLFLGDNASDDDARILGPLLLAGSIGGLYGASRALDGHDFSAGQGILVDLGTLAGGLLGMGVGYLVSSNGDDGTPVFALGALGADLGLYATFRSLSGDARRRAEDARGDTPDDGPGARLDLRLNPGALTLLHPRSPGLRHPDLRLPLFSLTYRF